jgi:hypothetical protein
MTALVIVDAHGAGRSSLRCYEIAGKMQMDSRLRRGNAREIGGYDRISCCGVERYCDANSLSQEEIG